jgi:hypothetical protein
MCAKIKRKKTSILQDPALTPAAGGSDDASSHKSPADTFAVKSSKDKNAMSPASSSSSSGSSVGPSDLSLLSSKVDPIIGGEDEKERASPPRETRNDRASSS